MDIKAKIEEIVNKLKSDKDLMSKFTANPIGTVEGLIGIDLPDDQIKGLVDGIQAKLNLDQLGGALGGIGKLFGK